MLLIDKFRHRKRRKLLTCTGTVPANKNYITGTVPANKSYVTGTVKKANFQKYSTYP